MGVSSQQRVQKHLNEFMSSIEGISFEDLALSHLQWAVAADDEEIELAPQTQLATIGMDVHPPASTKARKVGVVQKMYQPEHPNPRRTSPYQLDFRNLEIKWRTGFVSLQLMLYFVAVVSNGDIGAMQQRVTTILRWLEEWLFYFEFIWGRSINRHVDAAANYGVNDATLRKVFDSKLDWVPQCQNNLALLTGVMAHQVELAV